MPRCAGVPRLSSKQYEADSYGRGHPNAATQRQMLAEGASIVTTRPSSYDFLKQCAHPRRTATAEEGIPARIAGEGRECNSPHMERRDWGWNGKRK
jgi:hypothetical protein